MPPQYMAILHSPPQQSMLALYFGVQSLPAQDLGWLSHERPGRRRAGNHTRIRSNLRFMRLRVSSKLKIISVMGLLACAAIATAAQEQIEGELSAKQRILSGIGPGLRAVGQGADGRLYVLASPSPGLSVVDGTGKQLLNIAESLPATTNVAASHGLITYGDDCDVDAEGKIYVADR